MSKYSGEDLRALLNNAAWYHPFFLPSLTQTTFHADETIPTLCINADGYLRYNPKYIESITKEELEGCLFHEILHPLSQHQNRRGERKAGLWNIATDMVINDFLKNIRIKLPEECLYPPAGMENLAAETIYDRIKDDPHWQKKGEQAEKQQLCGRGCGCSPGNQKGEKEVDWGKIAAASRALSAGDTQSDALMRLLTPRSPNLRWESLLKGTFSRALAAHGRDEQTFTRRNRRSPEDIVFPGWKSTRARVAIVVDTSGSVSEEMLTRAVDHIFSIGQASGVKCYLVVHDAGVQWEGWISGTRKTEVASKFRGRGGTTFDEAYLAIEKVNSIFDAMVHLTDGEVGHWPDKPLNTRKLIAAIYGAEPGGRRWQEPPKHTMIVPVEV